MFFNAYKIHQVTCGYVICPLGESRRRRRSARSITTALPTAAADPGASSAGPGAAGSASAGAGGATAAAAAAAVRSPELRPSSEFTMYAHTDLGGNLPASVINKLCKKPAYRVLRKVTCGAAGFLGLCSGGSGGGGYIPLYAAICNII